MVTKRDHVRRRRSLARYTLLFPAGAQAEAGEVLSPPEVTSRPPRRLASREGMPGFNPRQKDGEYGH